MALQKNFHTGQKVESPWKCMADLEILNPKQMGPIMILLHNELVDDDRNKIDPYLKEPCTLSPMQKLTVARILIAAEDSPLLREMVVWFAGHWNEQDRTIIAATKVLMEVTTRPVRHPQSYKVEYEQARKKWAEFIREKKDLRYPLRASISVLKARFPRDISPDPSNLDSSAGEITVLTSAPCLPRRQATMTDGFERRRSESPKSDEYSEEDEESEEEESEEEESEEEESEEEISEEEISPEESEESPESMQGSDEEYIEEEKPSSARKSSYSVEMEESPSDFEVPTHLERRRGRSQTPRTLEAVGKGGLKRSISSSSSSLSDLGSISPPKSTQRLAKRFKEANVGKKQAGGKRESSLALRLKRKRTPDNEMEPPTKKAKSDPRGAKRKRTPDNEMEPPAKRAKSTELPVNKVASNAVVANGEGEVKPRHAKRRRTRSISRGSDETVNVFENTVIDTTTRTRSGRTSGYDRWK